MSTLHIHMDLGLDYREDPVRIYFACEGILLGFSRSRHSSFSEFNDLFFESLDRVIRRSRVAFTKICLNETIIHRYYLGILTSRYPNLSIDESDTDWKQPDFIWTISSDFIYTAGP